MSAETDETVQKTPLNDLHRALGGRMVPFAGYDMPVQFDGIMAEHTHTRASAGLFDVSHMGQVRLVGANADAALESLIPSNMRELKSGKQRYSMFLNDAGGILDDLMITRRDDDLLLVVNAACKDADIAHLQAAMPADVAVVPMPERALIALQGPQAVAVLAGLIPGVDDLTFMTAGGFTWDGADLWISRSGYTGEDGCEISVPEGRVAAFAEALLADDRVKPIGLGARDSLRLEAGLCLYGHDIDTTTSPVEANLVWAMQKRRREAGDFPGGRRILAEIASGPSRRRVGLKPEGRAPIREGAAILDGDGQNVGRITSGGFGPSVGAPVAMGYVASALAEPGTALFAEQRGKSLPMQVVAMPFAPHNYKR
ncbi:MAG: glycine cleavage system aminomethyltransferase GcvT [Minwuia sp.]|nr:glycine cleavage system aminomethyltransferase GcvT [Minwuia sp.]